ncbi:MAG: TAXI family TRAP transporter solute-binding subunit [Polaromonas sp.]
MKLLLIYRKRWWFFYLPVMVAAGAALWWSVVVWQPLPPHHLVMAAGAQQGSYARLAQRYAQQLERLGIQVELSYSDTQPDALRQLLDPPTAGAKEPPSIGFAHGIYAVSGMPLHALAVVGREPVWLFAKNTGPEALGDVVGRRVAAGTATSSTQMAARLMLGYAGFQPEDVQFVPMSHMAAVNALADNKVDLVFQAAGEDAQSIQLLLRQNNIQLLGYDQASALSAKDARLQPLLLPQGTIELRGNVPPRDLTLMSLQTHLLVRPGVHPALQRALLAAAADIHSETSFLQRHGEFPTQRNTEFVLSPTALAYSLGNRPWLESLLPYGVAQATSLLLFAVLPILAAAALLLTWIPRLFDWRISAALNYFYGELKFLESEMESVATNNPISLKHLLERLDKIERQVVLLDLPDPFSERWYTLREHLAAARERLLTLRSR